METAKTFARLKWTQILPRQYALVDCESGEQLGQVYGVVGSCNRPTGSWRHTRGERRFSSCKAAAAALVKAVAKE